MQDKNDVSQPKLIFTIFLNLLITTEQIGGELFREVLH